MNVRQPEGEFNQEVQEIARCLPAEPVPELSDQRLHELRKRVIGEIRAQRPRRRRRLVAVAALGIATAALFAGVTIATESGSHRQDADDLRSTSATDLGYSGSPSPYPTNARGQTYGPNHEGAGTPELLAAHAYRGENGYMYWADVMGPVPAAREEEWLAATTVKRREVPLYESDGTTQVGVCLAGNGDEIAEQPPTWLFDRMRNMASQAGDAHAWAWFVLTTQEQATAATGNSNTAIADPERPVYLTILLGDFTQWLWSLREGTSAPVYSWVFQIIDANTHEVLVTGASAEPFEDAIGLDLNLVGLRDRVRI